MAKKIVKSITESAFKKEVRRLDNRLAQVLDCLKDIRGELRSTIKNTGQMVEVQKQMIETQKQLIASVKTAATRAAARQAKKPRKLTEMNIFVREQIRSGKTFAEAIRAWKEYKASKAAPAESKPVSGPAEAQPQTTTETQQPPL